MAAQTPILSIKNWEKSLGQNFSVTKPVHAKLFTPENRCQISMQATEPETLRLVWTKPLQISGDFVMEIDLKLTSVGRDDNATGPNAKLEIELATGAPLNRRFTMQLIRDRYKIEPQYKIFRTDENWHHWRFEIRKSEETIRLIRDGQYHCAHKIYPDTAQASRFELRAFSRSNMLTQIEFGKIFITPLEPQETPATTAFPRLKHQILPGEWPMFRRDRWHSAHSPLVGDLGMPEIRWSFALGGRTGSEFLADINGDGTPEMVIGIPGRLAAYRLDGTHIWTLPVENAVVYGLFDLDGDGQQELVIANGGKIQVIDGKTGVVRFTNSFDAKYGVSGARIARLNPDQPGQQIVVCNSHHRGYCLSFEKGIANGRVAWTYDYKMANFVPGIAFADMDNDGRLELIAVTYSNFFVYDGVTGNIKMHLEAHTGRNYGLLVVQDLDNDGFADIVMFASRVREHIAVVKNEGGDSLRLLWDKFFEQNYPVDHRELRMFDHAADDFDGDGRTELLYGLWDESTRPNWTTYLVDALTGEIKHALENSYPINAVRFRDNQPPRVLISEVHQPRQRTHTNDTQIKIMDFSKGTPVLRGELPHHRLITAGSLRDYAPNVMREFEKSESILTSENFSNGAFFQVLEPNGQRTGFEFITEQADGSFTASWSARLPGRPSASDTLIAFYPDALDTPSLLLAQNDNRFRLFTADARELGQFPCGGVTANPLAGNLAGDGTLRILVRDAQNQLRCLRPSQDKMPQTEWSVPVSQNVYDWQKNQGQKRPVVVDLDLDGNKEVLVAQDPAQLTLLDRHGETKDQFQFQGTPGYYTFGQFTGRKQWDLYVAFGEIVSLHSQVVQTDSDQSVVWKMACGNGNPAVFRLAEAGNEDIIFRDLFEHRSLDGRTGRDVFPITQWCGYHIPTIVKPENKEAFIVWTGGAYSLTAEKLNGEQLWWRPFQSGWKPAGVADVDGDGRMEIGSATFGQLYNWPEFYPVDGPDGQFICLDALTGETKWEFPLKSGISPVITADVDGDGLPEFIFGTTDGHLIALRGGNTVRRVAFDVKLPAAVGAPIICDLFNQGKMQILVGCGDGKLYCIQ